MLNNGRGCSVSDKHN